MKKLLFIDRDGTVIEESGDQMLNEIHKFRFLKGAVTSLSKIAKELDYELVMVTNQDGLGTNSFPEKDFWPLHEMMLDMLKAEQIYFDGVYIDTHTPEEKSPYRKPGTAMLRKYLDGKYDLENSFVIGDRISDMELARNLGAKGILLTSDFTHQLNPSDPLNDCISLKTDRWQAIYKYLVTLERKSKIIRNTSETRIKAGVQLDGSGICDIHTGLPFLDHMLSQIAKHGQLDLFVEAKGDLEVDDHHTVEDVAIVLGQAISDALGKKAGINRYGFSLPMDDCHAWIAIDFGGRPELIWDVRFDRENVGNIPTEMFRHFFKSFSDHAKCNLYIQATGENCHHKIESIFKCFARAVRMAVKRDGEIMEIPSTKGVL